MRENYPDLYIEALEIERSKEIFRKELERCRTKDQVRTLGLIKTQQCLILSKGNPETALARMSAFQNVHIEFIQSGKYATLEDDYKKSKYYINKKKRNELKNHKADAKNYFSKYNQQISKFETTLESENIKEIETNKIEFNDSKIIKQIKNNSEIYEKIKKYKTTL